jgi:cytochrome c
VARNEQTGIPVKITIAALLLLALAAPAFAEGDAANGTKLFSRCSVCHSVNGQAKIGPTLAGVYGRKAGSLEGVKYSKALAASDLVWNDDTLDRFLAAPSKLVPGTAMAINLSKPDDRADMIAYLKSLKAP